MWLLRAVCLLKPRPQRGHRSGQAPLLRGDDDGGRDVGGGGSHDRDSDIYIKMKCLSVCNVFLSIESKSSLLAERRGLGKENSHNDCQPLSPVQSCYV